MQTIIIILLGASALLSISLERTYHKLPEKELKRRARKGDELANMLFRAVSYGPSLRIVLWTFIAVTNALFFVVMNRSAPFWFAVIASLAVIWFGYLWLPARETTKFGSWIAARVAPVIGWLMEYIHPLVNRLGQFVERHLPLIFHTGLYEKEDLIDLIDKQKVQVENRIDKAELDMVKHVLTFGDKLVRDFLTPRRVVKSVSIDESIGPVLMGELHKSGHSRFPVFDGTQDNIVGILYLRDVVSTEETGSIKPLVRKGVHYVHEEQSLYDVLQASVKSRQHLFVVVNTFEEYVGVITVEDVLEQIIGQQIVDEFDQYDDLRAVAARAAKNEHRQLHKNPEEKIDKLATNEPEKEDNTTEVK